MKKCQKCRGADDRNMTRWERIKENLFHRINHVFFSEEFDDLKSGKYTQGFADGNTEGFKQANSFFVKQIDTIQNSVPNPTKDQVAQAINDLLSNVDLHKVVSYNQKTGLMYIGGRQATKEEILNLKSEAEMITSTELWNLIHETPKELAMRSMFVEGENIDNMKKGRSILYTLSTQKKIIDTLKSYNPK